LIADYFVINNIINRNVIGETVTLIWMYRKYCNDVCENKTSCFV